MTGFDAAWLALREPADHRARADAPLASLAAALEARRGRDGLLRIVDLACGTGSNLRHLAPRLPAGQAWELVDHDEQLLAQVRQRTAGPAATAADPGTRAAGRIALRQLDLAARLDALALEGAALVTASALLDLVSARWLDALVARCAAAHVPVLFVLSYDGRIDCDPHDGDDALVRELVNRHQLGDKGFGPALGPGAADHAARALEGAGAQVTTESSDWRLDAGDAALQVELLRGLAQAAAGLEPALASRVDGWLARRLAHVAAGRSALRVGHLDVGARWP